MDSILQHRRNTSHAGADDFILLHPEGGSITEYWFRDELKKFFTRERWPAAQAEPPRMDRVRFKPHELRHFAVSSWIAAGAGPKTIQTWAGHSSIKVTMDTYGTLFPSDNHGTQIEAAAHLLSQ